MLLVTVSAFAFRDRREQGRQVAVEPASTARDLRAFLLLFPLGIAIGAIGADLGWRIAAAALLLVGYGVYTWRMVKASGGAGDEELDDLFFDPSKDDPPRTLQIVAQLVVSLVAIVGGAELFVTAIESIARSLGVSVLVLAPLATELLPEKANSILWIRRGKDALAVGNITGAMAFQSTVPVALGMLVTHWRLEGAAVVAGAIALAGGALALRALPRRKGGPAPSAVWAGLFVVFVAYVTLA